MHSGVRAGKGPVPSGAMGRADISDNLLTRLLQALALYAYCWLPQKTEGIGGRQKNA
jgi:hypothetical protein